MIYSVDGVQLNSSYSVSGTMPDAAYDKNGLTVWSKTINNHAVSDEFTSTLLFEFTDIASGVQGIAVDSLSQTIAQLYSGKIITIDMSDGSHVQRSSRNNGHGGAGQFEPTKKDSSDLYPTLWVSTQETKTVNDVVYGQFLEIYVGESQSTINRAFSVALQQDGNSLFAFDFENNIVYSLLLGSYYDETSWGARVDAYDLTDITETADVTYSVNPANGNWLLGEPIDSFNIDYYMETQSVCFFDGLLCLLSDTYGVVFIDVETHEEYLRISADRILPYEREGIGFVYNPLTNQTDMILSQRLLGKSTYYRYQFDLS